MAIPHAKPAEIVDLHSFGEPRNDAQTTTLIKTNSLEVLRIVLPAGKEIKPHSVPGEITVQCLQGKVAFFVKEQQCDLAPGKLLYVSGGDEHSLRASEDAAVLVTIQLKHKNA